MPSQGKRVCDEGGRGGWRRGREQHNISIAEGWQATCVTRLIIYLTCDIYLCEDSVCILTMQRNTTTATKHENIIILGKFFLIPRITEYKDLISDSISNDRVQNPLSILMFMVYRRIPQHSVKHFMVDSRYIHAIIN